MKRDLTEILFLPWSGDLGVAMQKSKKVVEKFKI